MSGKLGNLPISQTEARSFARIMLAGAMEITLDKLGRVLVPDYLKNYADLKKNVVICGLSNRLEIWDEDGWDEYKKKTEADSGTIAEQLGGIGI